jgi:hypothetical protein
LLDGLLALAGSFVPVGSGSRTIVRSLRSIGRSPRAVALGPHDDIVQACIRVALLIVQASHRVASLGAPIAQYGGMIAVLRHLEPLRSTFIAEL